MDTVLLTIFAVFCLFALWLERDRCVAQPLMPQTQRKCPNPQRQPQHDLVAAWETHTRFEFETRDVDATMSTMGKEPYVNHIPTMMGGVGYHDLKSFYRDHFIHNNPVDTTMVLISRTVGEDQLVDEVLFSFTHSSVVDWMLPGVLPTGRIVRVPLVAIVKFDVNGLVAHEHIYWDQASVLVQIGLLDPSDLPVVGEMSAKKALNKNLPSNELMLKR